MSRELDAMTLGELKELVDGLIGEHGIDTKVATSYSYGDHWNTEVVGTFNEGDAVQVNYSSYHRKFKVIENDDCDDDGEDDDSIERVIILK